MSEQTEMRIKMKTLVLAEKPSVGRDIGRVLHCTPQGNGFLEGKDYIVTWGLGHLVTLKDPEGYDKKYKEWKMEELPIMPKKLETEVIRQTAKQFQTVKKLVQRQDVKEIVIATDAGREGELVARWILKEARNQKPCRRLWVSSVTDKAIRDGFAQLKNSKEYDPLYRAAVSRAEADWLVGINATRVLTCKYNAQLSCGRVQTPTLAMIQARENEIRRFVPESYYMITAKADGITFTWKEGKTGSLRTYQKERAEEIKKKFPKIKIIIVTSMPECSYIERAKKIGIEGFWYKETNEQPIIELMEKVMSGEIIYPTASHIVKIGLTDSSKFTKKELEVLRYVTGGFSNIEISERLNVSPGVIKNHIADMLQKTGFRSRTQLAVKARESGIVILNKDDEIL